MAKGLELLRQESCFVEDDDEMNDFVIKEDCNWRVRKQVEEMRAIARGVMLITGEPGGGKDLYAVSTASIFKHFMGRPVLLDFVPRKLFGEYTLLNTRAIIAMVREIAKAWNVDGIEGAKDTKEVAQFMEEATIKWLLQGEGWEIFHKAVYYISELKKVAYNRNPNSRSNKFIGSLCTVWRHLDLLLMATHVKPNEIDVKAFLEYAKLNAHCTQTMTDHVIKARVHRTMYAGADFVLSNVALKPLTFFVNGNEPREYLGGNRFYDLYKTKQMSF